MQQVKGLGHLKAEAFIREALSWYSCMGCWVRNLCASSRCTGVLFQTPDFSPWHMRRVAELLRAELLMSMLGGSDGGPLVGPHALAMEIWAVGEKVLSQARSPLRPAEVSHDLGSGATIPWPLPANPPPGPQGRSWVSRESFLHSGGGKRLIKCFLVLDSVISGHAACFMPSFNKAVCTKVLDFILVYHHSSLASALPPCTNLCWVSDTRLLL